MWSFLSRQFAGVAAIFRPPFAGLGAALLLYYVWCYCVHPESQILRGNLPDPDDYMYLTQMLDWLKGQSWYDNIQHRADPPGGAPIHFSRLAMLPMAALTLLLEALGLKPQGAALIMAAILPPLLFAGFFAALRWSAAEFISRRWAGAALFTAFFSPGLLFIFSPGHVDHHGLVVTLVVLALGAVLRLMARPAQLWGIMAGAVLALALTLALEMLPWLVLISTTLGLWAAVRGQEAARGALIYALSLTIASAALLLTARPPADYLTPDVQSYSIVYVALAGGIALSFAALAAGGSSMLLRMLLGGTAALASGYLFFHTFPDLLGGPWGGVHKEVARQLLDNMYEAQPIAKIAGYSWLRIFSATAYALTGLGAAILFFFKTSGDARWRWGLFAGLLASAIGLSVFYQYRFYTYMGAFAALPLAAMVAHGWRWIAERYQGRPRFLAEIGLLLLAGPLTAVLVPATIEDARFSTSVLLFPADNTHAPPCDMYILEQALRLLPIHTKPSPVAATYLSLGPELLFRTNLSVLAVPYHMDVEGNLDNTRFFSTTDVTEAEQIARRHKLDFVIACAAMPGMYVRPGKTRAEATQELPESTPPRRFIQRLTKGDVPPWLHRANINGLPNYVVYKVDFETAGKPKPIAPPPAENLPAR